MFGQRFHRSPNNCHSSIDYKDSFPHFSLKGYHHAVLCEGRGAWVTQGNYALTVMSGLSTVIINLLKDVNFFFKTRIILCCLLSKIHPKSLVSFSSNYLFKQYLRCSLYMNSDPISTLLRPSSVILVEQTRGQPGCEQTVQLLERILSHSG